MIPTSVAVAPRSGSATDVGTDTNEAPLLNNQVPSTGNQIPNTESDVSTGTIGLIVGLVTLVVAGTLVGGALILLRKG